MSKKKAKRINGHFFAVTRGMRMSEAYKRLSANAVNVLIEMSLKSKRPWDWTDDEIITISHKEVKDKIKGRNQFYAARKEVVEWGFFEEIDNKMYEKPEDFQKRGLKKQRAKFRKDVKWKSISIVLKEEKERAAQSERDKKRFKDLEDDKPSGQSP